MLVLVTIAAVLNAAQQPRERRPFEALFLLRPQRNERSRGSGSP